MLLKCCNRWSSLESTFFCPQCASVRCSNCTIHEPVAWFCQQCLTESTKRGARSSGNHCVRNCVQCPRCNSYLRSKPEPVGQVKASCTSCSYFFLFKQGIPLAKQAAEIKSQDFHMVQKVVNNRFPAHDMLDSPPNPPITEPAETPPYPAKLRAKTTKMCRKCGLILIDPDRHPKSASLLVKHCASAVIPLIELYKTTDGIKLVAWHAQAAKVTLMSELAVIDLNIPPAESPGFAYPLFLVERETTQSRQAFMAGHKSKSMGPGWAVADIDAEELEVARSIWVCRVSGVNIEIKLRVTSVESHG